MGYFKVLSLILGVLVLVKFWAFQRFIKNWTEVEAAKVYPEKQPIWTYLVGLVWFALVFYTWFQQLVSPVPFSLLVAVVVTLPVLKLWNLLFRYGRYREWVINLIVQKMALLRKLALISVPLGVALLLLGIFVY